MVISRVISSRVRPNTRWTTVRSANAAMNISCIRSGSMFATAFRRMDTSSSGTVWLAHISNSSLRPCAPIIPA